LCLLIARHLLIGTIAVTGQSQIERFATMQTTQ
jgi:hypothetical protein